jgi:hypothetical protein
LGDMKRNKRKWALEEQMEEKEGVDEEEIS